MAYPDDFDTSAFVAGRRIALSRTVAIWVMISMFLIIACCVALPWLQRNMRINPFIVYVNGTHGEWHLIGRDITKRDIPYFSSMQRALVGIFTEKWFTITENPEQNELHWGQCNRADICGHEIANTFWNDGGCDLYCISGENMYQNFVTNVVPLYRARESFSDRWNVDPTQMIIYPDGTPTISGGSWIVRARVRSNLNGDFNIIAYVKVARDKDTARYPQTLGYYITGFNSYRLQ